MEQTIHSSQPLPSRGRSADLLRAVAHHRDEFSVTAMRLGRWAGCRSVHSGILPDQLHAMNSISPFVSGSLTSGFGIVPSWKSSTRRECGGGNWHRSDCTTSTVNAARFTSTWAKGRKTGSYPSANGRCSGCRSTSWKCVRNCSSARRRTSCS